MIAPHIFLLVAGILCVLNTIKKGKIYNGDKFAGGFVSIFFANAVNDIINQFYDLHFVWGVAIGFILYFLLYLIVFHITKDKNTNEQKWEIEKIKVNKCYRIMMAVVFTSLFLLAMLLCYIIIGDYAIRDYAYVWVLVYIILYIVLVGSMRIAVTEYILDCKPVGNLFPKSIPLQFIERTVIVKGKLNKVIVYYNNGKKVVLHPESPEAFVKKLNQRQFNIILT